MVYYEIPGEISLTKLRENGLDMDALCRHYVYITEFLWRVCMCCTPSICVIDRFIEQAEYCSRPVRFCVVFFAFSFCVVLCCVVLSLVSSTGLSFGADQIGGLENTFRK